MWLTSVLPVSVRSDGSVSPSQRVRKAPHGQLGRRLLLLLQVGGEWPDFARTIEAPAQRTAFRTAASNDEASSLARRASSLGDLRREAGLADARLARQDEHPAAAAAVAAVEGLPRTGRHSELCGSADER